MAIPACCSSVDLTSAIGPMVQLDYDELIPLNVHISAVLLQEELEIQLIFFFFVFTYSSPLVPRKAPFIHSSCSHHMHR